MRGRVHLSVAVLTSISHTPATPVQQLLREDFCDLATPNDLAKFPVEVFSVSWSLSFLYFFFFSNLHTILAPMQVKLI